MLTAKELDAVVEGLGVAINGGRVMCQGLSLKDLQRKIKEIRKQTHGVGYGQKAPDGS